MSDVYEFPCIEYDPWDSSHMELKPWDPNHKRYQVPIGDFCSSDSLWPVSYQDKKSHMSGI